MDGSLDATYHVIIHNINIKQQQQQQQQKQHTNLPLSSAACICNKSRRSVVPTTLPRNEPRPPGTAT
jgi:hypothetical protein